MTASTLTDPVTHAQEILEQADTRLREMRQQLLQMKVGLIACQPLVISGVLHGSLHPHDEVHLEALADVDDAKRDYDHAWREREDAQHRLQHAIQHCRLDAQKAWVLTHNPALAGAVELWQEKLRTATTDHAHAHAKKEYQIAMFQYQQAVAQAPHDDNGAHVDTI